MGPVNAGAVGIVLLASAKRFAKFAQIAAKASADIHPDGTTPQSPFDLQAMSDHPGFALFRFLLIPQIGCPKYIIDRN